MKPNSPPHRMIQLRRKTQKIVIPKASWDLSNKQNSNSNSANFYQSSKSKNSSSKKSSAQKSICMKKNLSMNQNTLKCNFKKPVVKNQTIVKQTKQKQKSLQKKHVSKKSQKMDCTIPLSSCFYDSMNNILKKVRTKQYNDSIKVQYQKCLSKFSTKNDNERLLFITLSKHIELWIDKCEILNQRLKNFQKSHSKYQNIKNVMNIDSEEDQQQNYRNYTNQIQSESCCSQPSVCSYIVDPQQQVKMKPIKKQLREQLQLNFSKVQLIRKKQME